MNMDWKYLFTNNILKRGRAYYQQGKVFPRKANPDAQTKTFYVRGTEIYAVSITLDQDSVKSMRCNCPFAEDGERCKHMAAALFQMEEDGDLELKEPAKNNAAARMNRAIRKPAEKPVRVYPFRKPTSGKSEAKPYQFYRFDKITEDVIIYRHELEAAELLIAENTVRLEHVMEGFASFYEGPERFCTARGVYTDRTGTEYGIGIRFTRDLMLSSSCDVPRCPGARVELSYYYSDTPRKMCAHLTALLLLTQEYIAENRLGDATDYTALQFMKECRNEHAADRRAAFSEQNPEKPIHLEPRLEVTEDGQLRVSFKIGQEKLYVVKDLTELVNLAEARGEMKLGTKHQISFAAAAMDEDSLKLYNYIKDEVKMANIRSEEIYQAFFLRCGLIKNAIPLYGRTLDEFYRLMENRKFPYTQKTRGQKITGEAMCDAKSPKISLQVESVRNTDGEFEGIQIDGHSPRLVEGTDYRYFFEGAALNRVITSNSKTLEALMQTDHDGDIHFQIGRRNFSEFYHRMLPALKEIAEVQIQDAKTIESYLYPAPEFSFFLDAAEDTFSCRVKVQYQDQILELTKKKPLQEGEKEIYEEYRDIRTEREVLAAVNEFFPSQDENGSLYCDEEAQQYRVLEYGVDALLRMGEVHATDRFQRTTIRKKPQITVGVRMESNLLKLQISSSDLTDEELIDVLNSYRQAKKYHRLRSGDFLQLEEGTMEELSAFLKLSKADPKDFVKGDMEVPAYRALYLDKILEKNEKFYAKRDLAFKHLVKEFKTVSDSEYEVPESLQPIMRGYQEFGYKWLRTLEHYGFGGILADDMGLGKTLQVISVLLAAKQEGRLENALIVTPASLVYNWKEEFAKFAPELSVAVAAGSKEEREAQIKNTENADILITSYDLLKRDILHYADKSFSYQIIDEAQYIKTHTTAAAKSVKAINSRIRFALTGTPIENRLSELWSIFDFLMPGFLYGYEQFRKELETPIVKHNDKEAMGKLKRLVEPFILRRLKQDVLKDLPEKNEEICYVHFDKRQQELYNGQVLHMKQFLEQQSDEAFQKNKMAILAEITKLRQICCDPSLCFENYDGASAKRETCLELLKSAIDGGHKILVFSQFRSLLELMEKDLQKEEIPYCKITGETKKEERLELVQRFNQDETPVFLISLKAGGTGLNLTGADIVLHFDPWWNLAAQNQATDRAHRIGQTKAVSVYKLIAKDSIEEKILKMQEEKGALADEILSGNAGSLMNMSKAELLQLL